MLTHCPRRSCSRVSCAIKERRNKPGRSGTEPGRGKSIEYVMCGQATRAPASTGKRKSPQDAKSWHGGSLRAECQGCGKRCNEDTPGFSGGCKRPSTIKVWGIQGERSCSKEGSHQMSGAGVRGGNSMSRREHGR